MREHFPLVFFTLLGQCAIGLSWISGYPSKAAVTLTSFVLMCLALLISARHLHYPRNSWRALTNWLHSPLSQEAVAAALFCALTGLATLPHLGIKLPPFFSAPFFFASHLILGIILLFSMARLYMLRTIPIWNRAATPLAFLSTTFLFGGLVHVVISQEHISAKEWLFLVIGLLLRVFAAALSTKSNGNAGAIQRSRFVLPSWWVTLNHPLTIAIVLLLLVIPGQAVNPQLNQAVILFLIVISEFFSRLRFYTQHGHDRSLYPPVTPAVSSWRDILVRDDQSD